MAANTVRNLPPGRVSDVRRHAGRSSAQNWNSGRRRPTVPLRRRLGKSWPQLSPNGGSTTQGWVRWRVPRSGHRATRAFRSAARQSLMI